MTKPAYVLVEDMQAIPAGEYVRIDIADVLTKVSRTPNDYAHIAVRWQHQEFDGTWFDRHKQVFWHIIHYDVSRSPGVVRSAFKAAYTHDINTLNSGSSLSVQDKRVYKDSVKFTFNIRPTQTMRPGDRIAIEFGYPYNELLVFRATCKIVGNFTPDAYCLPFRKTGENADDTGIFLFYMDHDHYSGRNWATN